MEEIKDIRIYFYDGAGQLRKEGHWKKRHIHPSVQSAKDYLGRQEESRKERGWEMESQYVLVEYTDKYKSKIIEIINYEGGINFI